MLLSCKKRKKERNLFIKTKTEYRNEEPNSFIGKRNLNAQLNYNFNPGKKGKAICGNSSSWNAVNCKIIQLSGCIIGYYWCLIVNLFGLFEQQGTKRNTIPDRMNYFSTIERILSIEMLRTVVIQTQKEYWLEWFMKLFVYLSWKILTIRCNVLRGNFSEYY